MTLIELTYLARDDDNGKNFLVSHDHIIGARHVDMKADDIHLIGITKMLSGTCLFLRNGQQQIVQEDLQTVKKLINEAT